MTIKQAREAGYTHYVRYDNEMTVLPLCDIEQDIDARTDLDGETLILCEKETRSIMLDPYEIVRIATEDLHEEAHHRCIDSPEFTELKALCEKLTTAWEDSTRTYDQSWIFLKEEHGNN